jgi:hypothetical protein
LLRGQSLKPGVSKVYVGPLVREGFADIDTGIRGSIRDIGQEVRAAGVSDVNVPMRPSR